VCLVSNHARFESAQVAADERHIGRVSTTNWTVGQPVELDPLHVRRVRHRCARRDLCTNCDAGQHEPERPPLCSLALIATGCTDDQAARRLGISPRTVRKHLESVFVKADVPSRAAAVAWWCRHRRA
jgi:hypothetical protein